MQVDVGSQRAGGVRDRGCARRAGRARRPDAARRVRGTRVTRLHSRDPRMPDDALLSARLARRPPAISAARRALSALNSDLHLISGARLRDALLLLSELVTNAVRNGDGQDVRLSVRATAKTLRVEVANSGAIFDPAQLPPRSDDRLGGWELRIVDAVAQRW